MSVVPDDWNDPESFNEMLYEIGWFVLAILVFSIAPFLVSFHYTRSLTPTLAIVSIGIGIALGTNLVYVSHTSDFVRNAWESDKLRFWCDSHRLSFGTGIAPAGSLVNTAVAIATFITAIPIRVFVYSLVYSHPR